MPEQDFTNREIMLMFNEIKNELLFIKAQTREQTDRLTKAEEKIAELSTFQTKVMTVWGVAVALISVFLNKFI